MTMENSVKTKQYKLLGIILGGFIFVFCCFMFLHKGDKDKDMSVNVHYKKEIATGIEGLSGKEMWIENSTNELSDIRRQNKELQEKLDKVQKVVIGMGRAMNVFDDQKDGKEGSIPEIKQGNNQTNNQFGNDNAINASSNQNIKDDSLGQMEEGTASLKGIREFVTRSKNPGDRELSRKQNIAINPDNQKLLKSGIKTISFTKVDNEYDLDENFIFAATYARCVLVGSVTVSAGIGSSSNPQPVLLRLTDPGNLPNKARGFLKDAMVIGAAYGELSSESVVIRLERIVKIDSKGNIGMDIPVQGYVSGENGDSRIRGLVIDRAGAVIRNAAVGGFFSGIADFLTRSSSSAVKFEPNSGLAEFSPQKGSKMLEQGASKGIGNAVEKYADFYIKRAEQLQPVIKIDGGRKLTIVFTQSVKAAGVNMKKVRKSLVTPIKFGKKIITGK